MKMHHLLKILFASVTVLLTTDNLMADKVVRHDNYFQQHVDYTIDVRLNIDANTLDVNEDLIYTNNSPDTLYHLYFHLYINKYRRNSLQYPEVNEDRGWVDIHTVSTADSTPLGYSVDRTIMQLILPDVLLPGDSINLHFDFEVKIPPASGRYGYQGLHYDVGNWYITPVVYDRFGWHLHQHLDQEFYQEWGDFHVTIRVPQDFRVGATGNLLNGDEVLPLLDSESPDWMRADYSDTVLIPWDYEALRVHDFAWTTDPDYKLIQSEWNGITLNVLVMDYNMESWKGVADWGIKALQYLSENFGMYPYQQMTVANTYIQAGGIEYPQIVMINDLINPVFDRGEFRAVIIHEMAHNWYYGLLANNQTEHEWLDEGLTSYAEVKTMEAVFGVEANMDPGDRGWLVNQFVTKNDNRSEQISSYLRMSKRGLITDPIDLHADYLGDGGYILQYNKMAGVMYMLEEILGDSILSLGINRYYKDWAFRHPYPEDFIFSLATEADCNLDWYFDQWLKTDRKLDYAFCGYEYSERSDRDSIQARLTFRRKEEIFMPVDFTVHLMDGSENKYRIPVSPYCQADTSHYLLPYWHFSKDTHSVAISLSDEIDKVSIDKNLMIFDEYQLDNSSGLFPPMTWHFMKYQDYNRPVDRYIWEIWPVAFYNDIDKALIGTSISGSYLGIDHQVGLDLWFKTATVKLDFDFDYRTPVSWLGLTTDMEFRLFTLDGRQGGHIGLARSSSSWRGPQTDVRIGLANHRMFDEDYLTGPWDRGNINTAYLDWDHSTSFRGWNTKEALSVRFQTSVLGSDYSFSQISLSASRRFWDGFSDLEFVVRLFAGFSDNQVPSQFLYNIAGDNGWGEFENIFYRSRGSLPWPWKRNGNLYKSGGPDIKGYGLVQTDAEQYGKNALAINLDLRTGNPLNSVLPYLLSNIYPHIFLDAGQVWQGSMPELKKIRASAGISLTWESTDILDYIINLNSIRLDFPVWLNDPGTGQERLDFRWLVRLDFN